jgi:hypothetical protein
MGRRKGRRKLPLTALSSYIARRFFTSILRTTDREPATGQRRTHAAHRITAGGATIHGFHCVATSNEFQLQKT